MWKSYRGNIGEWICPPISYSILQKHIVKTKVSWAIYYLFYFLLDSSLHVMFHGDILPIFFALILPLYICVRSVK